MVEKTKLQRFDKLEPSIEKKFLNMSWKARTFGKTTLKINAKSLNMKITIRAKVYLLKIIPLLKTKVKSSRTCPKRIMVKD